MHIPDRILSPPVAAATAALAAAGLAVALKKIRARDDDRATVLMGMTAAFVFAAQMVNYHLLVLPASGHLLGGVLAAVILGPWAGAVVVAAVLLVQCLLFQDGGLTALGANFLNMGLVGSIGGYAIYAPIRRAVGGRGGVVLGAMIAAWFSVLLAAGAFSLELAASGTRGGFFRILGWMSLVHAAIGLGEALITGLVLRTLLQVRPNLIDDPDLDLGPPSTTQRRGQVALAGLTVALAVAVFLAPLASEVDDGLEAVGHRLGFLSLGSEPPPVLPAPLADYALPLPGLPSLGLATAAAGALGTLVVFAVGLSLSRALSRRPPERLADAA